MLIVSCSIPMFSVDSSERFVACHSVGFLFSGHVSLFGNLCLQLFLYFLCLLSDRGISAALQEEKKATQQNSKRFCETEFPHGGSCFLYAGYSNRYFHRLVGSLDNCNVCHND